MMKRYVIGVFLLLLLITSVSVTAQDMPVFCGDLSEADCAFLQESTTAMQALKSTKFDLQIDVLLSDLPDLPVENLEFNLNGQGDFAADLKSFLGMLPAEAEVGTMTFFEAMADMLQGVNAEMTMSLSLPNDLSMLMPETDLPEQIMLEFRMSDGVAYLNLEDLMALNPGVPAGWLGIDLAELYAEVMPQQFDAAEMGILNITTMVQDFMQPDNASKFMTIERLDDTEVMGNTVAVFHTGLNYQNMMDIPAFREMLENQIAASGGSDAEFEEVQAMLDELYQGMTFDITQTIGLDDHLVYSNEWVFDWDLSFIPDMEAAPHFTLTMLVETTAFNEDFQVNVPEDAMLLPLKEMLLPE